MQRRELLQLGMAVAATPAIAADYPKGLDGRTADWQTKEKAEAMLRKFPGLKYVDFWQGGRTLKLSGGEYVPDKAPEKAWFRPGADDSGLRRAMENAHQAAVQVFLSSQNMKGAGPYAPEWMVRYIDGRPLSSVPVPKYTWEPNPPLCPNHPQVKRWKESLNAAMLATYEIDGLTLRYANYNGLSFYTQIFCCFCEHCERAAGQWGYNFREMRAAMRKVLDNLGRLDKAALLRMVQNDYGFVGFCCDLAGSVAPARWFEFRIDSVMKAAAAIRERALAVRRLKSARCGLMTYSPTFVTLAGMRYSDLPVTTSYIQPQLMHWQRLYMQNYLSMADWLLTTIKGITQADALRAVYRLFGDDQYPMPQSFSAMPIEPGRVANGPRSDHPALVPTVAAQLHRVKAWSGGVDWFPILNSTAWPKAAVEQLSAIAMRLGATAVWYF